MNKFFFIGFISLFCFACNAKKKAAQTIFSDQTNVVHPDANYDISGKWIVKVITPVGIHHPEMIVKQNGNVASGDLSGNEVVIKIMGDSVAFTSSRKTPIGTWDFDYTGNIISRDTMDGKYSMRSGPFAKKIYDWGARKVVE